jgi:hypothetical protein
MTLLRGLRADAIPGDEGLDMLFDLRAQKTEQRQARRESQAATLESLVSAARAGATEGQSLGQVRPTLESLVAGTPYANAPFGRIPGINELFGAGGVSTVNPQLDPSDIAAITDEVFNQAKDSATGQPVPFQTVRQRIHSKLNIPMELVPSTDEAILNAYKSATMGL